MLKLFFIAHRIFLIKFHKWIYLFIYIYKFPGENLAAKYLVQIF